MQPPEVMEDILNKAIKIIGMKKASDKPYICEYPTPIGAGGTGRTVVQPFLLAQPFVQSVGLVDDYAEAFEWMGSTYVMIFSCLPVVDYVVEIAHIISHAFDKREVKSSCGSIVPP